MTSDIDSRSILISTAPVHDPVPDNITYFEDAYTHLRSFKPKVATVVPHSNANSKDQKQEQEQGQVAITVSANNTPTVAIPVTGQDSDKDYGFNDNNDFIDALNGVLTNGNFDDVFSIAIHNAYQNGTINSDRPSIVGTSSVTLDKRGRMIVEEETDEESEAALSSTAITTITITSTSPATATATATGSYTAATEG
ncbi:hypothetical protein KI688_007292 [Linnemannia hyalina]|uniref:Uncharacterized protein n=1 Tax=Linnemannia hyalina TaxID=64524 RepID=A0A9P8BM59_9FUNG|nr:hypothetical protein KI688_007292 [Linnemannia hyalina]